MFHFYDEMHISQGAKPSFQRIEWMVLVKTFQLLECRALTKVSSNCYLAPNPQHVHLIVNWTSFRSFEALASQHFVLRGENVLAIMLARSSICRIRVYPPVEGSPILTGMFSTIGCAKKWAVSVPRCLLIYGPNPMVSSFCEYFAPVRISFSSYSTSL